jgi:outer membrane receptor protein involved in Fe transport
MRVHVFLFCMATLVLHGAPRAQQPAASCNTSVSLVPGAAPISLKSTAASVAVLDSAALSSIAGRTLSDALTARLPGVSVMRSSGVAGTGSRISIRGPGGLNTPQRPIVFIDGIRVDDNFDAHLVVSDSQAPSRLDDIPLDAISCVQVLRGPAATAAYGTDAAGGVILVTMRAPSSGQTDPIQVSGFAHFGSSTDGTAYPLNFIRTGTPPNAQVSTSDPLRIYTPFRVGRLANIGGSISAAAGHNLAALIRGSTRAQDGSLADNTLRRSAGDAALTFDPTPNLSVRSRAWLLHSDVRLPNGRRLLASTLLDGVPISRTRLLPAEMQQTSHVDQSSTRLGGGIDAEWKPAPWLVARAALGREDSRFSEIDTSPLFQLLPTTNEPVRSGYVQRNTAAGRTQRTSGTTSVSAAFGPEDLRAITTLALAYSSDVRRSETRSVTNAASDTAPTGAGSLLWRAHGSGTPALSRFGKLSPGTIAVFSSLARAVMTSASSY